MRAMLSIVSVSLMAAISRREDFHISSGISFLSSQAVWKTELKKHLSFSQ
jgi:hypothetical protein